MASKYEKYIPYIKEVCKKKGFDIDLEKPTTIQDKLNWLNIYECTLERTECTDKLLNHKYSEERIGSDICIPLYKTYNSPLEINWKELPQKFVLRCNHGSGMHIIVKDKDKLDKYEAIKQLSKWMDEDYTFRNNFEFNYHDIEHKIMAEELLEDPTQPKLLNTFRFWCFNGKQRFMSVQEGEFGPINHYDQDENYLPELNRVDYPSKCKPNYFIPSNFDIMKVYANKLSQGFRFVCVDFYEVNGKVYLKKMCFTPNANYFLYKNVNSNYKVGKMLVLGIPGENEHIGDYTMFKHLIEESKPKEVQKPKETPKSVQPIVKPTPVVKKPIQQDVKKSTIEIKKVEIKPVANKKTLFNDVKYKQHALNTGKYFINPLNEETPQQVTTLKTSQKVDSKPILGGFSSNDISSPTTGKIVAVKSPIKTETVRGNVVNGNNINDDTQHTTDSIIVKEKSKPITFIGKSDTLSQNENIITNIATPQPIIKQDATTKVSSNSIYNVETNNQVSFVPMSTPPKRTNVGNVGAYEDITAFFNRHTYAHIDPDYKTLLLYRLKERESVLGVQNGVDTQPHDTDKKYDYFNNITVNNDAIKLCIVHYNTPVLTECLIRSINKHTPNSIIYIFDNSDKAPFTYRQDNIIYLDNTKGQYINFGEWLKKYPNRNKSGEATHTFGSAKHCYSIEKCMELIDDNFILLDSDILLKKDISIYNNPNFIFVGSIEKQPMVSIKRVLPFICYINVDACKYYGVHYFDEDRMHGLYNVKTVTNADHFDTGAAFYFHAKDYPYMELDYKEYAEHFKGGSWENISSSRGKRTITSSEWLKKNQKLWIDCSIPKFKKVIYTCITGGYESLKKPSYVNSDFDYVCFTDANIKSDFWEIRPLPIETEGLSNVKKQRYVKINAHKVLPEYDLSVWIDGNVDIRGNINEYIAENCKIEKGVIAIGRHPERDCVYSEVRACVTYKKDKLENMLPQVEKYKKEGLPEHYGLPQTCIIFRYHNNEQCIKLMEDWWEELYHNPSHRDQLSISYVLWKNPDIKMNYLDKSIFKNKYFWWRVAHK